MKISSSYKIALSVLALVYSCQIFAGDVHILDADFQRIGINSWAVDVTLEHADSGWQHYADAWRVVDSEGNVLGTRVLLHPHEDEQPFTRGLYDVQIPANLDIVYIEAHDLVHGWATDQLMVQLPR